MKLKQKLAIGYVRAHLHILTLVSPRQAAKKAFSFFCTPRRKPGKKRSSLFDMGEKLSFRLGDHPVRGHRWLPCPASADANLCYPGNRPTGCSEKVLIAHGFGSSSRKFEQYVKAFLEKGYEVLAFDAPAHGQSGGKRITLPLYVDMIHAIHDRYGPIHSFMGHSLGGLALSLFLESVPHDRNTRLVLISPPVEMVSAVDRLFEMLELDAHVRTSFDEYAFHRSGAPFSWFSLRRALHGVRAEVLWLHDQDDDITPLADTLPVRNDGHPNIRFVTTERLGHRKIYRDGEVMRHVVGFL